MLGNPEELLGDNDEAALHEEENAAAALHGNDDATANPVEPLWRSTRLRKPTMKLLEMLSLAE